MTFILACYHKAELGWNDIFFAVHDSPVFAPRYIRASVYPDPEASGWGRRVNPCWIFILFVCSFLVRSKISGYMIKGTLSSVPYKYIQNSFYSSSLFTSPTPNIRGGAGQASCFLLLMIYGLRFQTSHRAWPGNAFPDMMRTANPADGAFESKSETRMRYRTVAADIEKPFKVLFG